MSNDVQQLEPIRHQAAVIKAMINHLQTLRIVHKAQAEVVEDVRIAFNKIIAIDIKNLRKFAGDENYKKMEPIDSYNVTSGFSYRVKVIVEEIGTELEKFIKLIAAMPVSESQTTNHDPRSTNHEPLIDSVNQFKNFEYGQLKNVFELNI